MVESGAAGRIESREQFLKWLAKQPGEEGRRIAVLLAARAALRVLPLVAEFAPPRGGRKRLGQFVALTAASFRSTALARVAGKYPARANKLFRAAFASTTAAFASASSASSSSSAIRAGGAAAYAARGVRAVAATASRDSARSARTDAAAAVISAKSAAEFTNAAYGVVAWDALNADIAALFEHGLDALADACLWLAGAPDWAAARWKALCAALPPDENWQVWFDWYDDRLAGRSRGEAHELVFASVPEAEWDKGPAAANAWIKAHLPKQPEKTGEPENGDVLKQQAGPFSFRVVDGRIVVAPEDAEPVDDEVVRDFYNEAKRKAAELKARLQRAQADAILLNDLARLERYLGESPADLRPGLLLSILRSLESDHRAYDTEEGRKEHSPDLLAMLGDVAGSVRDLAYAFPKTREIIANQIATELVEERKNLDEIGAANDKLAEVAEQHPMVSGPEVADALREPKEGVSNARSLNDKAGQTALRLLTAANFGRVVAKMKQLVVATGREFAKDAPKAASKILTGGMKAGAAYGGYLMVGAEGVAMIWAVAAAISLLNNAVAKKGGIFDRLEKILKEPEKNGDPPPPTQEKPPPEAGPRKRSTPKKPRAKTSKSKVRKSDP